MPQILDIEQAVLLLELEPPFGKREIQLASSGPPSRSFAIVFVPKFDDSERICRTVIRAVPRMCDSWITRSATWIGGASVKDVSGVTTLSSSAPAMVTILNVEPGS